MSKFGLINEINVNDPQSWQGKVFLTLDIDWAHDDVIENTIDLLENADAKATWFVTHKTKVIDRLRENPNFELGIHPNFNFLLELNDNNGHSGENVVDRVLELVPEATSVRSHSLTQSSRLMDIFARKGMTHDVNSFIPFSSGITLKPWEIWNKMIKVPFLWEDDLVCHQGLINTPIKNTFRQESICVYDFHPIHIFLNTESMERYELTRPLHRDPQALKAEVFPGDDGQIGVADHLTDLLGLMEQ